MLRPHPRSTLFPYTTLFRSLASDAPGSNAELDNGAGGAEVDPAEKERDQVRRASDDRSRRADVREMLDKRRCSHQGADRKSTRLNSSHGYISYAVFCLKKKN